MIIQTEKDKKPAACLNPATTAHNLWQAPLPKRWDCRATRFSGSLLHSEAAWEECARYAAQYPA